MKKMRTIYHKWTESDVQFLSNLGIIVNVGINRFEIEEDDERYAKIKNYFSNKRIIDKSFYQYTIKDIEAADYFTIIGWYNCGYPSSKIEKVSYDINKICPECKCGREQIDSLRVSKVSKHGFWTFFAWVADEFFVSKKNYEEIFAPYGIEKRDVIKGGKVLEDIYQLVIPVIDEQLDLSYMKYNICPTCGRIKYKPYIPEYAYFPLHKNPMPGIYKTKEYFGEGWVADHRIIICKDIVNKLIQTKDMKDYFLIPCKRFESDDVL